MKTLYILFTAILVTTLSYSQTTELFFSMYGDIPNGPILHISSLEWGSEGYHLWVIANDDVTMETDFENLPERGPRLLQLQFVKSALTVNPCTVSSNRENSMMK